jgi:anti-sigma regulatory factor (Ser/Thr protein kinase)
VAHLEKEHIIKAKDFIHAGQGSVQLKRTLKSVGFPAEVIQRASICAYEAEMNVVMHGGNGLLTFRLDADEILIDVEDDGPGIENIDQALQEGFTTASKEHLEMGFGAGMGLPNIKKNVDSLEIRSEKGKGTHLQMRFQIKAGNEENLENR